MNCLICYNKVKLKKKTNKLKYYLCTKCDFEFSPFYKNSKKILDYSESDNYVYKISFNKKVSKFNEYSFRYNKINEIIKNKKKKIRILDVGCGNGYFINKLKSKSYIQGLEINKTLTKYLIKKKINFLDKDLLEYYPDEKFDLILLFAVLEHLPDIDVYINHIKKNILSKNGKILLDVPNLNDPISYFYNIKDYKEHFYKPYHIYYFSRKALENFFKKHGFKIKVNLIQQASITNHFHWIHNQNKQKNSYEMSNVTLNLQNYNKKNYQKIYKVIDKTDDFYRSKLIENDISDLLFAEVQKK